MPYRRTYFLHRFAQIFSAFYDTRLVLYSKVIPWSDSTVNLIASPLHLAIRDGGLSHHLAAGLSRQWKRTPVV
jgi:hypothetical protein